MDRFYTTIDIVEYLNQMGFRIVGTIMKNRTRLLESAQSQISKLEKGKVLFFHYIDKKMLLRVWKKFSNRSSNFEYWRQ